MRRDDTVKKKIKNSGFKFFLPIYCYLRLHRSFDVGFYFYWSELFCITYGTKYSRMDQIKLVEGSL